MTTETPTSTEENKSKVIITSSGIVLKPNSLRIAIPIENQSGETILRLVYFDGKDVFIRDPKHVAEVQTALSDYFNN